MLYWSRLQLNLHCVYNLFVGVRTDANRLSLCLALSRGISHQDADLSGFFMHGRNADQS